MIDASGKLILSGNFFGGNLVDLGYFDECLDITSENKTLTIEIPGKPENTTLHIPAFTGQYVLTKILLDPTATREADFHDNHGQKDLADTIKEVIFCDLQGPHLTDFNGTFHIRPSYLEKPNLVCVFLPLAIIKNLKTSSMIPLLKITVSLNQITIK